MSTAFHVLTGARAGIIFRPTGDRFVAGRHAEAELRFDPYMDLSVSARHAEFVRAGADWTVCDLGSRNGTYVNGRLTDGVTMLAPDDVVTLGMDGPQLQYLGGPRIVAEPEPSATQRVRTVMGRKVARLRIVAGALAVALALVAATVLLGNRRERAESESERREMQARIDSLLSERAAAESSMRGEVAGLRDALQASEARLRELSSDLRARPVGAASTDTLERQLLAASAALRRQQLAASLDFAQIERQNRRAVAMIWVEFTDGTRVTGTAFAVRRSALLLTNRHLVAGTAGTQRPARIAVRFADSEQVFPARLVAASSVADLAAIQVDNIIGDVPVIHGIAQGDVPAGAPVALIGFPLGGASGEAAANAARPIVSAGVIALNGREELEVQGLGAAGASGSPIFDGSGELVGVLFGGRNREGVQMLAAVPARSVRALLAELPQQARPLP